MPYVVILAGPNGAGKSTMARAVAADLLAVRRFVNAEEIARGLAGFAPESAMPRAEEIKLAVLADLVEKRIDFGFETTLAGCDFLSFLQDLRQTDYRVSLVYAWLTSADLAVQRVERRSHLGGQAVDESLVRERYQRSLENLFRVYLPAVDDWRVYDNSGLEGSRIVAEGHGPIATVIHEESIWDEMRRRAGA
jgi:predicted ABC-type ATPase